MLANSDLLSCSGYYTLCSVSTWNIQVMLVALLCDIQCHIKVIQNQTSRPGILSHELNLLLNISYAVIAHISHRWLQWNDVMLSKTMIGWSSPGGLTTPQTEGFQKCQIMIRIRFSPIPPILCQKLESWWVIGAKLLANCENPVNYAQWNETISKNSNPHCFGFKLNKKK